MDKRLKKGAEDHRDMLVGTISQPPTPKHSTCNTFHHIHVLTSRLPQGSFIRHGIGREQLEGEIPFQIVAGSDTTATTLRGTMLNLMTTPYAYRALQQEIDEAAARGALSTPAKAEEGRQLEYLQVSTPYRTVHCVSRVLT